MLKINNKDYEVFGETIKFTKTKINGKDGYSLLFAVDFKNEIDGYLSFYIDFFEDKDFKKIENESFTKDKIKMFELFDTRNFIDYIDGKIVIKFDKISDNYIEVLLLVDDYAVTLEYNGSLLLVED